MPLPHYLQDLIDRECYDILPKEMARISDELTESYRSKSPNSQVIRSREQAAVYTAARMPATYAVLETVMADMAEVADSFAPRSVLDIGSGPGAAVVAAFETWDSIETVAFSEQNSHFRDLATTVFAESGIADDCQITPHPGRFLDARLTGQFDLVVMSYCLNEFPKVDQELSLRKAWEATSGMLLITEAGTPDRFKMMLRWRDLLVELGAQIVGPCNHQGACPLADNWCHFSQRLPRSSRHKQAKGASLGYEDEKFSWLAVSREAYTPKGQRIIAPPNVHKVAAELMLCQPDSPDFVSIPREVKDLYKAAKKSRWGDRWG